MEKQYVSCYLVSSLCHTSPALSSVGRYQRVRKKKDRFARNQKLISKWREEEQKVGMKLLNGEEDVSQICILDSFKLL